MKINAIRRIIGWIFIGLAIWLFFPIPGPDDILNFIIGNWISINTGLGLKFSIFLTYTLLPFIFLGIGCWISPGSTDGMFINILNKMRRIIMRIISDWRLLVFSVVMFAIMYYVYVRFIIEHVLVMFA
jgi:hypothetical protein